MVYYAKVAGECLTEWDMPDDLEVGDLAAGDVKALVFRRCRGARWRRRRPLLPRCLLGCGSCKRKASRPTT